MNATPSTLHASPPASAAKSAKVIKPQPVKIASVTGKRQDCCK